MLHTDEIRAGPVAVRITGRRSGALQADPLRVTARTAADGRIVVVAVPLGDYNRSLEAAQDVVVVDVSRCW